MAQPPPQTNASFYYGVAVHVWMSLGTWLDNNPSTFDRKVNELARQLHAYTPEVQQAQTMAQRIQYASMFNGEVAVLEHQLLWSLYGYNEMVWRLMARRPFQGLEEAMQFLLLPLRYCITMQLKAHTAHIQNAVRLTHEAQRSDLIGLARGPGIQPLQMYQYHLNAFEPGLPQPQARRLPVLRMNEQIAAPQQLDHDLGRLSIEAAASQLVQATVDLGQHVADNLGTVIRTFREDTERQYELAQRLHEAVRREQNRQFQGQPREGPSAQNSHPIQIVQEPLEPLQFTLVPERAPESRMYPRVQPLREGLEDEDEREEEPRLHLRGGAGDNPDSPEEPETPGESDSSEEPIPSGEPMSIEDFDDRIFDAVANRINPPERQNEPDDMLQWIIQNIGKGLLHYTKPRGWNAEADSRVVAVNRIGHKLQDMGVGFQQRENGEIGVMITRTDAHVRCVHCGHCARCGHNTSSSPPLLAPGLAVDEQPPRSGSLSDASSTSAGSSETSSQDGDVQELLERANLRLQEAREAGSSGIQSLQELREQLRESIVQSELRMEQLQLRVQELQESIAQERLRLQRRSSPPLSAPRGGSSAGPARHNTRRSRDSSPYGPRSRYRNRSHSRSPRS